MSSDEVASLGPTATRWSGRRRCARFMIFILRSCRLASVTSKKCCFEGAGGETEASGWLDLFETALSDAALSDGQREFSDFAVATKEELFYLRSLANSMDVKRIPHLRGRLRLEA